MIQMLVDGAAGEIVVDRDCAIRLSTMVNRIYLLMDANGEGHIPIILTTKPIQRSLFAAFTILFF